MKSKPILVNSTFGYFWHFIVPFVCTFFLSSYFASLVLCFPVTVFIVVMCCALEASILHQSCCYHGTWWAAHPWCHQLFPSCIRQYRWTGKTRGFCIHHLQTCTLPLSLEVGSILWKICFILVEFLLSLKNLLHVIVNFHYMTSKMFIAQKLFFSLVSLSFKPLDKLIGFLYIF